LVDRCAVVLQAESVITGYANRVILKNVSVAVGPGEVVAIIGHNGAGKSTLLKVLIGLLPVWGGKVYLDGISITPEPRFLRSVGVAYLPQGGRVFSDLTVKEHLQIASNSRGQTFDRSPGAESAMALLPQLKELILRYGRDLSSGERQLLALAMVMIISPRVILLDEPLLGVDPVSAQGVLGQLRAISKERGVGMLIVEQKVREVLSIADKAYVMRSGIVSFAGCAKELRDLHRLKEHLLF